MQRVGGNPFRSAYMGESTGSWRSWSPTYGTIQALQGRKHRTEVCEAVRAVEKPGVSVAGEIHITGEEAQNGWQRETGLPRRNRHLSRQHSARGRSIDANPLRRILLESVPIYRD